MFGLDPESIVNRVTATGQTPRVPTLRESVLRGALGFTLVSLGGFAPWVLAGRWFYRNVGEAGLYAACAIVFIGLSGWLLHRLIIGPGAVIRFYQLFSLAFVAYAILWTAGWMTFGGVTGGLVGLLAGTAAMGAILACGFAAWNVSPKIIVILFVTNAAGYLSGSGRIMPWLLCQRVWTGDLAGCWPDRLGDYSTESVSVLASDSPFTRARPKCGR